MSDASDAPDAPDAGRRLREFAELLYEDAEPFACVLDADGTIRFANETARTAADGAERLDGRPFWEGPWWPRDDERRAVRERVATASDGERQQFETTHARPDGGTADVEMDARPIRGPATDDDVLAVVVTGRDVTERSTLAEAQRANLDALEGLYETSADPELSFDERVRELLRVGQERLGLGEAFYTKIDGGVQVVKTSIADHPRLQEGERAALSDSYCKRTVAADEPVAMNHVSESPFGDDSAFDVFGLECYLGAKLVVGDTVHGTICFADTEPREAPIEATERAFVQLLAEWLNHELEHRRHHERLERQNERLNRFAGVVSHDLSSPLNVASGHLDLAASKVEGDAGDHVADAIDAVDRMTELVDEVRSLAEQGDVVGDTEPVSLSEVAREAADTALPEDATLSVDTPAGDVLEADRERLRTVFENLYSNAANHGGDGVAVTVASYDAAEGDGEAGFYVADDGPGFSQDDPEEAFEEGHTTRDDGTGYGLSIVVAIAEAHGWTTSASESEAGGARFDFAGVEFKPAVNV